MKIAVKNVTYKIFVAFMIIISLLFFRTPAISQASRIKVKEGEFYYSGTQDGQYVVEASLLQKIMNALSELIDYIVGLMTLGLRGVVIGWIEIFEIILTTLLETEKDFADVFSEAVGNFGNDYEQKVVTIEKIIFNEVKVLDANLFNLEEEP